MLKKVLFWLFVFTISGLQAQEPQSLYSSKKISFSTDSILVDKASINPDYFQVLDQNNQIVDSSLYRVDFPKAKLIFKKQSFKPTDSLKVRYLKLPDFLTKEYSPYDPNKIMGDQANNQQLYKMERSSPLKSSPFDGLLANGTLSRGFSIGNNQNLVVNSNLDFQITGKISEKISLRASIKDNNIPVQEGSYSQRLNQYDNIFMELFTNDWNLKGGDIFIGNQSSKFLTFNKKIQGLHTAVHLGNEQRQSQLFAAAGLASGNYASSSFKAQEGNQGPYKLLGKNGELYVLVVIGSERVYVNGILLKRGENLDYLIDYNSGELVFTPQFPVTSEMRIVVEYQYSENNYNRIVTYDGGTINEKKWSFGAALFAQKDLKNQPIQQELTVEQQQILSDAGDNPDQMYASSAIAQAYEPDKILYKKIIISGETQYEYSDNPQDELYQVSFTQVGMHKGNYLLSNPTSVEKIFRYIAPLDGIPQGNYQAISPIFAPIKEQLSNFFGNYRPTEKTSLDFELALSDNDKNLFSSLDDSDNKGLAGELNIKQRLYSKDTQIDSYFHFQALESSFKAIERINDIEFYRDWNLINSTGKSQSLLGGGLILNKSTTDKSIAAHSLTYDFQKLKLEDSYRGIKNKIDAQLTLSNWRLSTAASLLNSESTESHSKFLRSKGQAQYHIKNNWAGSHFSLEDNQETNKLNGQLTALSQRFYQYGLFLGKGDSTKVYLKLGYINRQNDSIQNNILQRVNHSNNYRLEGKLIKNELRDLQLFINYRQLHYDDEQQKESASLNAKIQYSDQFFKQFIQSNTRYETHSGTMPFQDYTYVEVPAGQGKYTWNDYNANGIKDLEEFEIAPFPDLATYTRIFLPNQNYIKTSQNRFLQDLTINPTAWKNTSPLKKALSHFYLQSSFSIDQKLRNNEQQLLLNPFEKESTSLLGLMKNFTNNLYFNRGLRKHSLTYTYSTNDTQNLVSISTIENKNKLQQLQYQHLWQNSWLLDLQTLASNTATASQSFPEKNYAIKTYSFIPKISYLYSKNLNFELYYHYSKKENEIGTRDLLSQNQYGTSCSYVSSSKFNMTNEVSFYDNDFRGAEYSSAGYQMLEGFQKGKNISWRSLVQMNLTKFLDLNFAYQGRKSQNNYTIHNGSVELRAYF